MLLQIRDFMKRTRIASNQQLAREFHLDIEALEPMLKVWLSKGVLAFCQQPPVCQSQCFKCYTQPIIYYSYVTK